MKRLGWFLTVMALALVTAPYALGGQKQTPETDAVVTMIDGTARLFTNDEAAGRSLRRGDKLGREDEVRVGEGSRIEIRFPDGTMIRLSERTRLAMNEIRYDRKSREKKLAVSLGVGRLWATVRKLLTPSSSVEVKTANAVAGVRGTVYRMTVEDDQSAMVRVYDGSVYVAGTDRSSSAGTGVQASPPVPVPGPHEVSPPHEVTMEEWHVIVKAMQQITISSRGLASKPEDFDPRSEADDWVKWNRERDKQAGF